MENSIKEAIERLKLCSTNQCNICGRYEKEECMLERNRCEQHILSEYKKVLKENEELKQDRNNNYQMIALAQNEALGYMQGYEDGKKLKRSAVANIVENQQYYIFNKQIEHYKEYIEKLQKENEELKEIYRSEKKMKNEYIKLYQDLLLKENVIPTQNVKDKIEELNRKIDKSIDNSKGGLDEEFIEKAGELLAQKRILQELLEGRK